MPQLRFWLLASLCFFTSGCQSPLFVNGIGSFWSRGDSGSTRDRPTDGTRTRFPDGTIQQVSAEVDVGSNRQQRIFQLLSQGNQELTVGRLPDAKLYFEQVLDADPTNFHAHHMLARIGDQTQSYEYAEGHYLAALSASPGDPNLLSDMGYSYLLQGEFRYANTYLRRAVTAKPDHVMARRNLAALAAYQGDYNTALAWLRQVGTEEQAQTTLRELMTNRPPQFRAKRDSRNTLAPDATPAARELNEQLRLAREQSGRAKWKREMEEWTRESRERSRYVTGTSYRNYPNIDPRRSGQISSDGNMQQAMRALEDEYSQRLMELQQRSSIPSREPTRFNPGPQSSVLSEQMRREQMRREAEAQLRSIESGQPQMVIPPAWQPQNREQPRYQEQPRQQGQQLQPRSQYQNPRTGALERGAAHPGLNPVPNQHQLDLLPPPSDFDRAGTNTAAPQMQRPTEYADPRNPQGTWNPQGGVGPMWNPQTGNPNGPNSRATPAASVDNAEAARRAMALGMSAGPGSLFPLGVSPQNAGSVQPPNQQSFNGAVPIQPGGQSGGQQTGQQPVAQPGSVQPARVQPHWTPGQAFTPPIGGEANLNRNWQSQQAASPTWNHATNQPITQQQHWSQAAAVNEAYRNQGIMTSPTTRSGFGPPHFVAREQQLLRSTTPADQLGAPASDAQ